VSTLFEFKASETRREKETISFEVSSKLTVSFFPSSRSDITGLLTSTFVFVQYLWAIAMASATFLLLRKPASQTTACLEANWKWAWVIFYAISFSQVSYSFLHFSRRVPLTFPLFLRLGSGGVRIVTSLLEDVSQHRPLSLPLFLARPRADNIFVTPSLVCYYVRTF